MNAMQLCKIQLLSLDLKYPEMFCFMALKVIHFLGLLLLGLVYVSVLRRKQSEKYTNSTAENSLFFQMPLLKSLSNFLFFSFNRRRAIYK